MGEFKKSTKSQYIEQYAKNSPVFGIKIKYGAVAIYSFSETAMTAPLFQFSVS